MTSPKQNNGFDVAALFMMDAKPHTITTSHHRVDGVAHYKTATCDEIHNAAGAVWTVNTWQNNLITSITQMPYGKMLADLSRAEIAAARSDGINGSDSDIVVERLKRVSEHNVLHYLGGQKQPERQKINPVSATIASLVSAFAVATAFYIVPNDPPAAPVRMVEAVPVIEPLVVAPNQEIERKTVKVDYTAKNNSATVGSGDYAFPLHFKRTNDIYGIDVSSTDATNLKIAKVRGAGEGDAIEAKVLKQLGNEAADHADVKLGETFILQNKAGYYLQGRVHSISLCGCNNKDEVVFEYQIVKSESGVLQALGGPVASPRAPTSGEAYATYDDGEETITIGDGDRLFSFRVSDAGNGEVYVYNDHPSISGIENKGWVQPGTTIQYGAASQEWATPIAQGSTFIIKNDKGYYMQGHITGVYDRNAGDENSGVIMNYQISDNKSGQFRSLGDANTQTYNVNGVTVNVSGGGSVVISVSR